MYMYTKLFQIRDNHSHIKSQRLLLFAARHDGVALDEAVYTLVEQVAPDRHIHLVKRILRVKDVEVSQE